MLLLGPYHLVALLLLLVAAGRCLAATGRGDDGRRFVYNGFIGVDLTLDGAAQVMPNGLLMLTNGSLGVTGHAFHPFLLPFRNATGAMRSFSTIFAFAIFGQYDDLSSDGMAFFVSASKETLSGAQSGRYLGLLNQTSNGNQSTRIFAVELDTSKDAEFLDINNNHVGVDVDSLWSLHATPSGYNDDGTGLFQNLSLINRKSIQVWVDYDATAKEITVTIAPLGVARPKKPLLQTIIDLSDVVQSTAYVGFSSASGSIVTAKHFVLGWSFALDEPAPALNISILPALPPASPVRYPYSTRLAILPSGITLLVLAVMLALAIGIGIYICVRQKRLKYSEVREDWEVPFGSNRFSYKDLFHATKGFSDKNLLGRGGFGTVYKGVLREPEMEVAVKRMSHDSRQGVKEFIAEVVSVGRLRHRNLVQLLGYCRRKDELLLVYEYMKNGSLDKYLHGRNDQVLCWSQRYSIIKGVASSLLYLHEDWEQVVIHRDIKASNVLLDSKMNGRLGDFGLARIYDHENAAETTHVAGTMGYLAPELSRAGRPTPFSDVYAFGVFLLEVTCGRKPIFIDDQSNRVLLVEWVLEHHHNGSMLDTVDPRLGGEFNTEEVTIVLKLGLLCTYPSPNARPIMRKVMQYLDLDQLPPDLSPAYISYIMMAQMQNERFDSHDMACSQPAMSVATLSGESVTILREGR
ncbi:L-type lectin-domain containing receptor kinase SIT2-like [Hordeum vulgare subsp. vulgare]|uniref:non-specific serine/threonine protein kinase n=1 Tax=Hordeum vulgare subsp. vulgare TaxID=112509 RepID=A0A8I6WNG3_HORVV|nr:L-type lectin-domain containing receptor kinase SIT2-like [Hordeum vulgare subsp. vulgare]